MNQTNYTAFREEIGNDVERARVIREEVKMRMEADSEEMEGLTLEGEVS